MTSNEIYASIKAQINTANENAIPLKDCMFIIGCDVINTLFNIKGNMPFNIEVKDMTICGVDCCISSMNRDICILLVPAEEFQ